MPAIRAATAAAGEPLAAGLLLLGHAVQRRQVPLPVAALIRAIELNGGPVARNLAAFHCGRSLAAEPEALAALGVPADSAASLADDLQRRVEYLTGYQHAAWAERYRALVERVRAAETACLPGSEALSWAVLRSAFQLMAYKDEYEVARLHSAPAFRRQLEAAFEGPLRLSYHLAPPLLARRDPVTGVPRKSEFGAWMGVTLRLLARGKCLRGTPLDPFGWTTERRMERRLIEDYVALVDRLLGALEPGNLELAVEIAALAQEIRGFGHVKQASLVKVRERERELLARWPDQALSP